MDIDKIITLLNAGYTKEEIQQMEKEKTEEPEVIQDDIQEAKEPEKEESAANQVQDPDPVQDQIAKLTAAMERMSGMIISKNINRTVTEGASERSIDDMLAEVINPPRKERGK